MSARKTPRPPGSAAASAKLVILIGAGADWQREVGTLLSLDGYRIDWSGGLDAVLPLVEAGRVQAVLFAAGPLPASDLLALRRMREASARTAVVVVSGAPNDPDLKRAFESGATAFLSWPASLGALRHAIRREAGRPGATRTPTRSWH
jgi:DNA-binding response OmpR family regulator